MGLLGSRTICSIKLYRYRRLCDACKSHFRVSHVHFPTDLSCLANVLLYTGKVARRLRWVQLLWTAYSETGPWREVFLRDLDGDFSGYIGIKSKEPGMEQSQLITCFRLHDQSRVSHSVTNGLKEALRTLLWNLQVWYVVHIAVSLSR